MSGTQRNSEMQGQRDVLTLVLAEAPVRLSVAELEARLDGPLDVAGAVDSLVEEEVLVREGDAVVPTPPTVRFQELAAHWR